MMQQDPQQDGGSEDYSGDGQITVGITAGRGADEGDMEGLPK